MAYDCLKLKIGSPVKQAKEYLEILYLAARGTESEVDNVLRILFDRGESISVDRVKSLLDKNKNNSDNQAVEWFHQVLVKDVDLSDYDQLLSLSLSFSFPDAIATASAGSAASAMQMSEVEVSHGY